MDAAHAQTTTLTAQFVGSALATKLAAKIAAIDEDLAGIDAEITEHLAQHQSATNRACQGSGPFSSPRSSHRSVGQQYGTERSADNVLLITQGVYRRPTDGAWQVYQVPLTQDETQRTGRMVTTTPTRTAADIYCGIGAAGSRRSLDHLVDGEGLNDQLLYWPSSADPLHERDHGVWNASPADEQGTAHRMSLIGELLHHSAATQEGVLAAVVRTLALPGLRSRRASLCRRPVGSVRLAALSHCAIDVVDPVDAAH